MNVSELARRLKVPPQQLREALPELGFDIGMRAIKIDDHTAWKIIEDWPELKKKMQQLPAKETPPIIEEEKKVEAIIEEKPKLEIPSIITVREFASLLNLPISKVVGELMKNGILTSMNERIDYTTASIIAQDLGIEVSSKKEGPDDKFSSDSDIIKESISSEEVKNLKPRPPVVVVIGHVDHGKTTLLDAIRKTNVVAGESGGITQHIGAYQTVKKNRKITFIDTPGHEAFTTMRSRGARVADIAILIVAADDGVQPQTLESLKIIQAAKVPFVVAVNKIDKEGADPEIVKRGLSEKGVLPEEWGGKTPFIPISAKKGIGLDELLDVVLLVADLNAETIVSNPEANGLGTIVESHVDQGEGPVATVLVQNGTLHIGDVIGISKSLYGKIRAMKDWEGKMVKEAPPGMPVKIIGFKFAPEVGDIVKIPDNPKELTVKKTHATYMDSNKHKTSVSDEEAHSDEKQIIDILLKTDTLGSLEAITSELDKIRAAEVGIKVISKGLGNITESDVLQSEASGAIIYGFQVTAPFVVEDLAREKNVTINTYKIIYELLGDIKERLQALLKPEIMRIDLGTLKVIEVFRQEKNHAIIGGRVESGKISKGAHIIIKKDGEEIGNGEIMELQMAKQAINEVPGGSECGMKIKTKARIEEGDTLNAYKEERKERKLII